MLISVMRNVMRKTIVSSFYISPSVQVRNCVSSDCSGSSTHEEQDVKGVIPMNRCLVMRPLKVIKRDGHTQPPVCRWPPI
jgi:hypothetical protein